MPCGVHRPCLKITECIQAAHPIVGERDLCPLRLKGDLGSQMVHQNLLSQRNHSKVRKFSDFLVAEFGPIGACLVLWFNAR